MSGARKALFYTCPLGHGNRTSQKCPICKSKCQPVYDLPFERNWALDSSRLDYELKKSRERKNDNTEDQNK